MTDIGIFLLCSVVVGASAGGVYIMSTTATRESMPMVTQNFYYYEDNAGAFHLLYGLKEIDLTTNLLPSSTVKMQCYEVVLKMDIIENTVYFKGVPTDSSFCGI